CAPQWQYCASSHQRHEPGVQLSVQVHHSEPEQSGSSQSGLPSQSSSCASLQTPQSGHGTHAGLHCVAFTQSLSSQSTLPSQSLSLPSPQLSGAGTQGGLQAALLEQSGSLQSTRPSQSLSLP